MKSVVKALRYRFVQCEEHPASLIPTWKGSTLVRPHVAYTAAEMKDIRAAAKDSPEISLAIELLYETAGRIQDVALLHWSAIQEVRQGSNKGYADVKLKKLKSTAREV